MARALDLAWRGWGRVHPNPLVGAVVLADGELVGEGWHAEFGGPHAEPVALAAAGERARGATLVVTLEPCAHQGKQPPCVDAVLAAGIRRVVVALADPHPAARGGAERLRAAGLEVEIGLLGDAAAAQNARFLHQLKRTGRPWVALKLATSLDHRIADAAGRSKWISGPEARAWTQWLRAGFDAIAVGGRTALADDPLLTVRGATVPRVAPRRVVFSPQALLAPGSSLVRTAREVPLTVVADPAAQPERLAALEAAGVHLVLASRIAEGLERLHAQGVEAVLVEGGGRLAGALVQEELLDRYYWVQSPLWLGDAAVRATAGIAPRPLEDADRWRVVERRALGPDTLLVVDRP
ncbi:MAG TPA: bifunctional diaminohydroxyphosphoribosylaminopyrimidine deaminase/5-amino-6-(5-phosphoribosylamino)uracil reductase RibD [Gemmatimonadales bacterium]|nr:bifunctional diaminohydroxyphosphoribosylaminopyrimidine deaminase/5-amino-6-(5-phosphoribosylamino)uracil reductase RibD [Gemmatimonadales bacterium]